MHSLRRLIVAILAALALPPIAGAQAVNRAKEAYLRAIELEAQKNDAAALSLLWEAAGLAPRDADIQNRLGEALDRIGALDAAIAAYRSALAERPDFRKASNNLILALVKAGQGAEAVMRARAVVEVVPDDPDRLFTLGLAQSEQDVAGAIETFRRVLALAPRHTLARYNLALVLKRSDRLTEAIEEVNRSLAIEPRPEAYYTQGVIYWHLGNPDRAMRALRDAIASRPRYADAYLTLGSILKERRDWTPSADALRRAIAIEPDQPAAHYTLGQVFRLSGDEPAARAELATADRLRDEAERQREAAVWTAVGIAKFDRDDLPAALECFRRGVAAAARYAPAHYQMGRALQRLGQPDAARAAFDRARQLNPSLVPPG